MFKTQNVYVTKGTVFHVCEQMTTEVIDIDEKSYGGNASAEGTGDEGAEASSKQGVDVVMYSRLVEYALNKKDYMVHIKEYMARLALQLFFVVICTAVSRYRACLAHQLIVVISSGIC